MSSREFAYRVGVVLALSYLLISQSAANTGTELGEDVSAVGEAAVLFFGAFALLLVMEAVYDIVLRAVVGISVPEEEMDR